jgi:hypothetical protein
MLRKFLIDAGEEKQPSPFLSYSPDSGMPPTLSLSSRSVSELESSVSRDNISTSFSENRLAVLKREVLDVLVRFQVCRHSPPPRVGAAAVCIRRPPRLRQTAVP